MIGFRNGLSLGAYPLGVKSENGRIYILHMIAERLLTCYVAIQYIAIRSIYIADSCDTISLKYYKCK